MDVSMDIMVKRVSDALNGALTEYVKSLTDDVHMGAQMGITNTEEDAECVQIIARHVHLGLHVHRVMTVFIRTSVTYRVHIVGLVDATF